MKKILLLILFALLSQGIIFAANGPTPGTDGLRPPTGGGGVGGPTPGTDGPQRPPTGGGGIDGPTPGTNGPRKPKTPIDTNKAVLVITAALIVGAAEYRRTSLKKA